MYVVWQTNRQTSCNTSLPLEGEVIIIGNSVSLHSGVRPPSTIDSLSTYTSERLTRFASKSVAIAILRYSPDSISANSPLILPIDRLFVHITNLYIYIYIYISIQLQLLAFICLVSLFLFWINILFIKLYAKFCIVQECPTYGSRAIIRLARRFYPAREVSLITLQKCQKWYICVYQVCFSCSKIHQNSFSAPGSHWGSLWHSSRPHIRLGMGTSPPHSLPLDISISIVWPPD